MSRGTFDDPNSDAARQFLLDRKSERCHPKRHRTTKRMKALGRKKRQRIKHRNTMREVDLERYRAAVRAYWSGAADEHPGSMS